MIKGLSTYNIKSVQEQEDKCIRANVPPGKPDEGPLLTWNRCSLITWKMLFDFHNSLNKSPHVMNCQK